MQLASGTLLHGGTYKIDKVLGQGSFGITYLAEHTSLGKKVAIKEFFMKDINTRLDDGSITGITDGSLSHNYAQKFRKEAMNLARIEHPNIVRVTDSFDENGTFYYVMDYIDGQNLNDYLKQYAVSEKVAVDIIKDVANAQGKYTCKNGDYFDGTFACADYVTGYGKKTYGDGSIYEGNWKDGRWHGKGTLYLNDHTYRKSRFKNGEEVKILQEGTW